MVHNCKIMCECGWLAIDKHHNAAPFIYLFIHVCTKHGITKGVSPQFCPTSSLRKMWRYASFFRNIILKNDVGQNIEIHRVAMLHATLVLGKLTSADEGLWVDYGSFRLLSVQARPRPETCGVLCAHCGGCPDVLGVANCTDLPLDWGIKRGKRSYELRMCQLKKVWCCILFLVQRLN